LIHFYKRFIMRLTECYLVFGLLNCISALPMQENASASNQSRKEFPKLEMMMDELLTKLSSINEKATVEIIHGIIQFINSVGRMSGIPLDSAKKLNNDLGNITNTGISPNDTIEGVIDKSNSTDNKASDYQATKRDALPNEESEVTPPVTEAENALDVTKEYLKVKEEGERQNTTVADTLTHDGDKTEFETNVTSVTDDAQTLYEAHNSTGDTKENTHTPVTGDGQTAIKARTSIADNTDIETSTDTTVTGDAETTTDQVDTSTDDKADTLLSGNEQSTTDTYNTTGTNIKTKFD